MGKMKQMGQFQDENNGQDRPHNNVHNGYGQPQSMGMDMPARHYRDRFGKGVGIGIAAGLAAAVILLTTIFSVLYQAGYIHLSTSGEVYVQDSSISDDDGIGSSIENKLNVLDTLLDGFYFDDVDRTAAQDSIFKAYVSAYGDKYTVYYTPEEYQEILESTSGTFYGIGAVCQKNEDGSVLIVEAYQDAPAYQAGLRNGDCVLKADGRDLTGLDLSAAVALIKGEKGTAVELEVRRGEEIFTVRVIRDEVKVQTVQHEMLDNGIGYLRISQFDDVTTNQFKSALNDLKTQGMKSLVIDIRSNPGGLLSSVVDILDEILPDGLIVYTENKAGNREEYKGKNSNELDVPLAVLVNENSASASEIFAGAVQDYQKGNIIGKQTYGKGIVQTIRGLTDGSAVKYTIAKYFTPLGQDIHGKGVTPDQVVELSDGSEEDTQLQAAVSYLMGKTK